MKQNAELQKEFQVTRYIWTFAEQWRTAKKADLLEIFWLVLGNSWKNTTREIRVAEKFLPLSSQMQQPPLIRPLKSCPLYLFLSLLLQLQAQVGCHCERPAPQ